MSGAARPLVRRPGLRASLVAIWVGCLVGAVAVLSALAIGWYVAHQVDAARAGVARALAQAAEVMPGVVGAPDLLAIDAYLHAVQAAGDFSGVGFYSAALGMEFDTRLIEPRMAAGPGRPGADVALAAPLLAPAVHVVAPGREHLSQAVRRRGAVVGVLSVETLAPDRRQLVLDALRRGAIPVLGILGLALGGGIFAAARVARPIEHSVRACERLAAGILSPPVVPPEGAEGVRLARALREIAETLRQNADRIDALVTRDALTGLANRATFARQAGGMLAGLAARQVPATLILVEVIGLGALAERHGDEECDAVIRTFAERLSATVADLSGDGSPGRGAPSAEGFGEHDPVAGSSAGTGALTGLRERPRAHTDREGVSRPLIDLVGRLGGAEFAVLLHNCGVAAEASTVAARILAVAVAPIPVTGEDTPVSLGARLGVALKRGATLDYPSLRRAAGAALVEARVSGQTMVVAGAVEGIGLRHVPDHALAD